MIFQHKAVCAVAYRRSLPWLLSRLRSNQLGIFACIVNVLICINICMHWLVNVNIYVVCMNLCMYYVCTRVYLGACVHSVCMNMHAECVHVDAWSIYAWKVCVCSYHTTMLIIFSFASSSLLFSHSPKLCIKDFAFDTSLTHLRNVSGTQ